MADDKSKKDARDRNQVAGNENYEVKYLAKELKVTEEVVRAAIKKVGNDRKKLIVEIKANS